MLLEQGMESILSALDEKAGMRAGDEKKRCLREALFDLDRIDP